MENGELRLPDGAGPPSAPPDDPWICPRAVLILVADPDPPTCRIIEATIARPDLDIKLADGSTSIEDAIAADDTTLYDLIVLAGQPGQVAPRKIAEWIGVHQPQALVVLIGEGSAMRSALGDRVAASVPKPLSLVHLRHVLFSTLERQGLIRLSADALRTRIGKVLRERRKEMNMTLTYLSKKTQMSIGYLSQIELGHSAASVDSLYRICNSLGIGLTDLFDAIQSHIPLDNN